MKKLPYFINVFICCSIVLAASLYFVRFASSAAEFHFLKTNASLFPQTLNNGNNLFGLISTTLIIVVVVGSSFLLITAYVINHFNSFKNSQVYLKPLTSDEAKIADQGFYEQYGIKCLRSWVNNETGKMFCLTEGPIPDSNDSEVHGNMACNLQKVEQDLYKLLIDKGLQIDHGITLTREGSKGTILVVNIRRRIKLIKDNEAVLNSTKPQNTIVDTINNFNGKFIQYSDDDNLVGVFYSPGNAICCAINIQKALLRLAETCGENSEWDVTFRMGLNHGQSRTEKDRGFDTITQCAQRLCMIAEPNQILLSANLKFLYELEIRAGETTGANATTKILSRSEERFVNDLFEITEQNLQLASFNVNNLSTLIGISRPQIYRKIISLTGKSPNEFIRHIRMNKALELIKSKERNISEIALEVGYSNPSYFTKVFNRNFGFSPSTYHTIFSS